MAAILLLAGTGLWGIINAQAVLAGISLGVAARLVVYVAYVARRLERT